MLVATLLLGAAILAAYYLACAYRRYRRYEATYNLLPGPQNLHWLFGSLHEFPGEGEDGLAYNIETVREFPYMNRFWLGKVLCVVIFTHPETVRLLLKSSAPKPMGIGTLYQYGLKWLGEGLLIANGDKWQRNRKLMTPAFHFDILIPYTEVQNKCVDILLEKLQGFSERGENFEGFYHIGLCSLDIISRCAFSYQTDGQALGHKHPYVKAVHRLSELWVKRSMNIFQFWDWAYFNFMPEGWDFTKNCKFVHKVADEIIKDRKKILETEDVAEPEDRKRYLDFLDILLMAKDENGNGLSDLDIRSEVDTFMFEGHDTTTSGISNTLLSLAQHPEIQEKVRQEVDQLLEGRDSDYINWKDLSRLEYLTMCIKEGLRLYSPVHAIQRELTEDIHFKGYTVPKGSPVVINIFNLHHNVHVWGEDVNAFRPDRFSPENVLKMDPFAFVPFSAGSRNCIGQNFAMMEMKIMIARIIHRFKLETVPGHVYRKKMGVVMRSENGILLTAVPRKS